MAEINPGVHGELVLGRHQVIVNLKRVNLEAVRNVLNVGESLSAFVRAAVIAELARRAAEDLEALAQD